MIESMKRFKWHLLIIVVISFGGFGLANSTPLEPKDSQERITSSISTENQELHQKLQEGCEIDAYIKQGGNNCEMKIKIKEDFLEPTFVNELEIEKAINVELIKGCFPENSVCERDTLHDGTIIVYKKPKEKSKVSLVWHWDPLCRRQWRVDLDTKLIKHGFTYAELFRVAEELMHRDKTKLGEANIIRKKIVFGEIIPDRRFLLSVTTPAR